MHREAVSFAIASHPYSRLITHLLAFPQTYTGLDPITAETRRRIMFLLFMASASMCVCLLELCLRSGYLPYATAPQQGMSIGKASLYPLGGYRHQASDFAVRLETYCAPVKQSR
jgi:hypothetical protein